MTAHDFPDRVTVVFNSYACNDGLDKLAQHIILTWTSCCYVFGQLYSLVPSLHSQKRVGAWSFQDYQFISSA